MSEGEERKHLIALYRSTRNRAFLRAALDFPRGGAAADLADLLARPEPVREGRPAERDFDALVEMHLMVARGEVADITKAARILAARNPGYSTNSTYERLRKKERKSPEAKRFAQVMLSEQRKYLADLERMETVRRKLAEDGKNSPS